jgi:phage tail sheath protein FI
MPITPSYPGIYIEELPSSAHTITAAPTSITVFVGYTHPFKTLNFAKAVELFSFADYEREFGGLYQSDLIDANVANAVNQFFLNGGSDAYVVGLNPQNYTDSKGNTDNNAVTVVTAVSAASVDFGTSPNAITFTAREPVDKVAMKVTISNPNAAGDTADIVIAYGNQTETFRKVKLAPSTDPDFIENRIGTAANPISSLVTVSPNTAYPATYPFAPGTTVADLSMPWTAPAGAVGVFNPADFASVFAADSDLDKVPIFNLMAVPGIINNAVLSEALAFCERKLAFLVMDPPVVDIADPIGGQPWVNDFLNNPSGDTNGNIAPRSQNGALYFPYLNSIDPITGVRLALPPSGFVTGIYARTDTNRGVWKAPAGLETTIINTTGVVDTGRMTDPRQGVLNLGAVNCIRTFPGSGSVIFGARTLVGQTPNPAFEQWRYVPVRRMALFIEQTLRANLTWVIFEPNDEPLWVAIRTSIENFMLALFNQGAFQGTKPSQAFQVKCDSSTTTQDDINNGIVNIIVAFAPLKPAEFVIVKIAQLAGQAQA